MAPFEFLKKLVTAFEALKIPYFITGSVASMMYGEPRFTNDADIVAGITERHLSKLHSHFPDSEYYFDEDAAKEAVRREGQFNIIHPASGFKIDVVIAKPTEFDRLRFSRAKKLNPEPDWQACYASPEDVIIKKMEYYKMGSSEKHLRDITGILKVSEEMVDRKYIREWASRLGLSQIWEAILKRTGH